MNTIQSTDAFDAWLAALRDSVAKAAIIRRIALVRLGSFGDCKALAQGLYEMRVHVGQGYRVYYVQDGSHVYLLLSGGDKRTQSKDIAKARILLEQWRNSHANP